MTSPEARGTWPYVDIVVVKDYEQSERNKKEAKCFVRIHMDIPVQEAEAESIDEYLKNANYRAVFDKLPLGTNVDPRALATLKGALGQ